MTAEAEVKQKTVDIIRPIATEPILVTPGPKEIGIATGVKFVIDGRTHDSNDATINLRDELEPGKDYGVILDDDGTPFIASTNGINPIQEGFIAGFHFAPASHGGNGPSINPQSIWDLDFRPSCPDPRSMTLVEIHSRKVWVDIYLLGVDHIVDGTSHCSATIADGVDLPVMRDGKSKYRKLDYQTAVEIYAHHGKRLLTAEEFFAAAYGVKERCSRTDEPTKTGVLEDEAQRFISRAGLFDATGTMWQWGTDGHPDDPRPSIFGGSWFNGSSAGSRFAVLVYWPEDSFEGLSARGACDHLSPA